MNDAIRLGDEVRDSISGFAGVAAARTVYLHGSSRIGIAARAVTKDEGKPYDIQWFEESQLLRTEP